MATHPENSIPGFLHAMACGADGAELDVAVTLDDVLVVTHDLVLKSDGRIVREHRAAELPLPALDEVLALDSPEKFWFDIEAKSAPDLTPAAERYAMLIGEAIRRASVNRAGIRHRVVVRSFDHSILRAVHTIQPNLPLAALIGYPSDAWPSIASAANASIISPHYSTVTAERVRSAHDTGIRVSVWTVDDPGDWDRMAALGVDTIITNDPGGAVRYFSR
jgi:glycerophosphoryl diester phosphodiesterase